MQKESFILENSGIKIVKLGKIPYQEAVNIQESEKKFVLEGKSKGSIFFLEHTPVVTLGRHHDDKSLIVSKEVLEAKGIEFHYTSRGGNITAHEPGQLVSYPVLSLKNISNNRVGPKLFINKICNIIINFLKNHDLEAKFDDKLPGVWVNNSKVAAIGMDLRNSVSMHGFAFNIFNDLKTFHTIVPCGIKDKTVVSLSSLLELGKSMDDIISELVDLYKIEFNL